MRKLQSNRLESSDSSYQEFIWKFDNVESVFNNVVFMLDFIASSNLSGELVIFFLFEPIVVVYIDIISFLIVNSEN